MLAFCAPARKAVSALATSLVNTWMQRARSVRITAWGNTRALVRQARLHGLICNIRRAAASPAASGPLPVASAGLDALAQKPIEGVELEVSGPLALFRHTLIYGRASSALIVPFGVTGSSFVPNAKPARRPQWQR